MARNFLVEKYNFVTLCTLIRYRGKKVVYLVDMVNFYPNNSLYANIYIKIGNIFFGNNHLIRFPIYSSNYDRYADVLWQSNSQALDFLQKYGETFRQTAFGQYLKNTFQDDAAFTAFKKNILENIVLKFLFYNSYTELCKDGVNLHKMISACADNHGVAEYLSFRAPNKVKSKTASVLTYFYGKLYVLFFSLFSPFFVREILKKKISWSSPRNKKFDLGIHIAHGIRPQGFFGDSTLLDLGGLDYKKSLFIYSIWQYPPQDRLAFQQLLQKSGSAIADEFANPIPVILFFTRYVQNYFIGLSCIFRKTRKSEWWMVKVLQKMTVEYFSHHVFCQYYQVKIFFSRDDYSARHILRTIAQNKYGLLNVGLQHSAFLYPRYIPQSANSYFDVYYIAGEGYRQLWKPYWDANKKMIAVGHKGDGLVKSAMLDTSTREFFLKKYKGKTTVLLLISAHTDTISPYWLLKSQYSGIHKIFDIDESLHLILCPRREDAILSFLEICPELQAYIDNGRCTIEFDNLSTHQLIAFVDVLVSEEASSTLLESLCRKDLFSFYYMVRYRKSKYQENLVVYNSQEFYAMIFSYFKKTEQFHLANQARDYLRANFTVSPEGETMLRIASSFKRLLESNGI